MLAFKLRGSLYLSGDFNDDHFVNTEYLFFGGIDKLRASRFVGVDIMLISYIYFYPSQTRKAVNNDTSIMELGKTRVGH